MSQQPTFRYNRLREVLRETGVRPAELAERIGKTYRVVVMYVNNEVQPPLPVIFEIARALGVKPHDLIATEEECTTTI